MSTIDSFLDYLRAGGSSEQTIYLRKRYLLRLERFLGRDIASATERELVEFLAHPSWSRETRRSAKSTLSTYYAWAARARIVEHSPAQALPRVRPVEPAPHPTPRAALEEALARAKPRELLMIRLAAEAGLRRGEVVQVHERDLMNDLLGDSLLIHGKGDKPRIVPLSDSLARAVRAACKAGGGYAFPGEVDGHLSAAYAGKLVSRLLPEGVSMHSLRHRFATVAYTATHDLRAIQELLGHASVATTQRYVATDAERLRAVALSAA